MLIIQQSKCVFVIFWNVTLSFQTGRHFSTSTQTITLAVWKYKSHFEISYFNLKTGAVHPIKDNQGETHWTVGEWISPFRVCAFRSAPWRVCRAKCLDRGRKSLSNETLSCDIRVSFQTLEGRPLWWWFHSARVATNLRIRTQRIRNKNPIGSLRKVLTVYYWTTHFFIYSKQDALMFLKIELFYRAIRLGEQEKVVHQETNQFFSAFNLE